MTYFFSPLLLFLNIGGGELFIILFVVLLLFGSKKIPELARGLGRGIRQFKDATREIQDDIEGSIKEIKKPLDLGDDSEKKGG